MRASSSSSSSSSHFGPHSRPHTQDIPARPTFSRQTLPLLLVSLVRPLRGGGLQSSHSPILLSEKEYFPTIHYRRKSYSKSHPVCQHPPPPPPPPRLPPLNLGGLLLPSLGPPPPPPPLPPFLPHPLVHASVLPLPAQIGSSRGIFYLVNHLTTYLLSMHLGSKIVFYVGPFTKTPWSGIFDTSRTMFLPADPESDLEGADSFPSSALIS